MNTVMNGPNKLMERSLNYADNLKLPRINWKVIYAMYTLK
jgi:hypothetical protein